MNKQLRSFFFNILAISIVMLLPMLAFGQLDGTPTENIDAPIDGGLSLLVVAGVGYSAKKLKEKRKKKEA